MKVFKRFVVSINIDIYDGLYDSKHDKILAKLRRIYEKSCYKRHYIDQITELEEVSMKVINREMLQREAIVAVKFMALCIIYTPGTIISNAKVTNITSMSRKFILQNDEAHIILNLDGVTPPHINDIVPVIVDTIEYSVRKKIVIIAKPLSIVRNPVTLLGGMNKTILLDETKKLIDYCKETYDKFEAMKKGAGASLKKLISIIHPFITYEEKFNGFEAVELFSEKFISCNWKYCIRFIESDRSQPVVFITNDIPDYCHKVDIDGKIIGGKNEENTTITTVFEEDKFAPLSTKETYEVFNKLYIRKETEKDLLTSNDITEIDEPASDEEGDDLIIIDKDKNTNLTLQTARKTMQHSSILDPNRINQLEITYGSGEKSDKKKSKYFVIPVVCEEDYNKCIQLMITDYIMYIQSVIELAENIKPENRNPTLTQLLSLLINGKNVGANSGK
jgi:hypothetical protein